MSRISVCKGSLGCGAELWVICDEPEQRVHVKQESHSMYSFNSCKGSSKSSATRFSMSSTA